MKNIGVMFKKPSSKGKYVDGAVLLLKMEDIVTKQKKKIEELSKASARFESQ